MPPAHAAEPSPRRAAGRARDRWLVLRWYELLWDSVLDLQVRVGGRGQDWVIGLVVLAGLLTVIGQSLAAVLVIGGG